MGGIGGLVLERLHDDPLDVVIADGARSTGARLVDQPIEAALQETLAPLAHRCLVHAQAPGHLDAVEPVRACQHDARALSQRHGALRPPSPSLQGVALLVGEDQLGFRATSRPNQEIV